MLNKALISNPINWFTIATMLLVAWYAFHLVLSHYHDEHP